MLVNLNLNPKRAAGEDQALILALLHRHFDALPINPFAAAAYFAAVLIKFQH